MPDCFRGLSPLPWADSAPCVRGFAGLCPTVPLVITGMWLDLRCASPLQKPGLSAAACQHESSQIRDFNNVSAGVSGGKVNPEV